MIKDNQLNEKIIGCGIVVHSHLGPGLLESAYQACLYHKLMHSGLNVLKEVPLPVYFEGVRLD